MFTGIVEEAGVVQAVTRRGKGWSLEVEVGSIVDGVKIGDSVAVNGCCLTVTEVKGKRLIFDLLDGRQVMRRFRPDLPDVAQPLGQRW